MRIEKLFNPHLLMTTFFGRGEAPGFETREEAKRYAIFLAESLTLWATIDIVVGLTLLYVSTVVSLPWEVVQGYFAFAIGCPVMAVLGLGYGCLQHLTLRETYEIVRNYFLE
jgi:hypothetical protein